MQKKLILTLALIASPSMFAMHEETELVALADRDRMTHDFLYDHAKFRAQWCRIPRDVSCLIAQRAITSTLAMLMKKVAIPHRNLDAGINICEFNKGESKLAAVDTWYDSFLDIYRSNVQIWDVKTNTCLHLLDGHDKAAVNAAKFNPGDTLLVTASNDNTSKIWDVETGMHLHTLEGHTQAIYSAEFNSNGSCIATGEDDDLFSMIYHQQGHNAAKIWDVKTGICLHTLTGHTKKITSVQFNANDTLLVTASNDNTAKVWDAETGNCLFTLAHASPVTSARFHPDGTRLVTASEDFTAKLLNAKTGTCLYTLNHTGPVHSAVFNQEGTLLVTASEDGTAKLWDVESGTCLQVLNHVGGIKYAEFDRNGTLLITTSKNNSARLWNVQSGACITTILDEGRSATLKPVRFSPGGTLLTTQSVGWATRPLKIWYLEKYFTLIHYLQKKLSLEQAMLINCIFQTAFTNKLLENRDEKSNQKFSFKRFPHLQEYYESLPDEVQLALKEYVALKDEEESSWCSVQ